ncbi:MAG: hypothetical protein FJW63_09980 [Actinobacteria bacterium]|nr:hypothetical protein [Actinomycetota bacterium]
MDNSTIKIKKSIIKIAKYQALSEGTTLQEFIEKRILSGIKTDKIKADITASEVKPDSIVAGTRKI